MASIPPPAVAPNASTAPPAVVLDTNAVLDWLVFRHASCVRWESRFAGGSVRWLASSAMRDELAHVLGRGVASAWAPDMGAVWATWDRWATPIEAGDRKST